MDNKTLIAVAAGAALFLFAATHQGGDTAGDDESNFIWDGLEQLNTTGWPSNSGPYQETITDAAQRYGVPVAILAWLLWKESRYSEAVITGARRSRRGALGIAQFMPATAIDELGSVEAALDPDIAIPGAARYLAKLYRQVDGWDEALAAYNWGIGNVKRRGLDAAPPETVDYFTSILDKSGYYA